MPEAVLGLLLYLLIAVGPIAFSMIVGMILEKMHFTSITKREAELQHIPTLNTKQVPDGVVVADARLVTGAVVVSIDHFKRFLARLRNIVGGEVKSYCSLLDRGRREAILRMKAANPNADLIINMRVETSAIAQGKQKEIGCTEVIAYGTAIQFAPQQ